jgi:myosin heavy subunit
MEQMKDEVQDDPLAAETMADALGTARRLAISGQMRDSGSRIESNRIGQAMQSQQEILDHLDELLDVLANRREHELGRLVKKLREAADELSDLAQRQKGLRKKVQQASAIADQQQRADELQRLAKQQQELADQARNLSRRLQRLQAERSSAALSQAASELDSSAEAAQQSDSAAALEDAAQAQQDLEEAQQQLAERIRQAEQDLLYEEITRLEQEITGLIKPQQNVIDETVRLEGLRASQGRLSRGQFATLNDLADQQRSLAVEAGSLADKVAQAQAFQFGLQGAADDMNRAATRLDAHESGAEVQQAERNALNRLQQLLAALQPDAEAQQADAGGGSDGQPSGQEQAMPVDSIHALAELKLLKSMQQEINQRTIRFEEIRREKGSLTDEQQQELVELAGEQGRLAEVMLKLVPAQQPSDDVDGPFEPEGTFDEALEKSLEDAL